MAVDRSCSQQLFTEASTLNIKVYGSTGRLWSKSASIEFKYLGPVISADGCLDKELTGRLQKATGAFNSLYPIWNNRNIWTNTNKLFYLKPGTPLYPK